MKSSVALVVWGLAIVLPLQPLGAAADAVPSSPSGGTAAETPPVRPDTPAPPSTRHDVVPAPTPTGAPANHWTFYGRSHVIGATNSLSGPGAATPGLATTHNMSLFEWNWGGRQALFNGSGVTTNANYPVTEGAALTTNTRAGMRWEKARQSAGANLEFYGRAGDEVVGRVFGEELPFGDFRTSGGRLVPRHSQLNLYQFWYKTAGDWGSGQLVAGTLSPDVLPEISRKEINYLKLGSLIYRPPITNASFFEKDDRKIETGRQPLFGTDLLGDVRLSGQRKLHYEMLWGRSEPTPVSNVNRDVLGGRIGLPLGRLNLGLSAFSTDGTRLPAIAGERQNQQAADFSYALAHGRALYGAFARSDYSRGISLDDDAWVLGARLPVRKTGQLKLQYQRVGEDYDLMGHHKVEHYPSNWAGWNADLRYPLGKKWRLGMAGYWLHQLKSADSGADTIFGDSYFPSLPGTPPGDIRVYRLGGERPLGKQGASLLAYIERAEFRKTAAPGAGIDKDVTNGYVFYNRPLGGRFGLEVAYRLVLGDGRWQAMNFDHAQSAPEIGIVWKGRRGQERARLVYQRYDFNDDNPIAGGANDWRGNQLWLDVFVPF